MTTVGNYHSWKLEMDGLYGPLYGWPYGSLQVLAAPLATHSLQTLAVAKEGVKCTDNNFKIFGLILVLVT